MKVSFLKLVLFIIIMILPMFCYPTDLELTDCDSIKDVEEKIKCQEEKVKDELNKVEKHEHTEWSHMDTAQKDETVRTTLKSRQIDSK